MEDNQQKEQRLPEKNKSGFKRLLAALKYSLEGLIAAWKNEPAIRTESLVLICAIPIAFIIADSCLTAIALISLILLIIIVELLNSAIEKLADLITSDFHPAIKLVKDYGSAAVFITVVIAMLGWLTVLLQKLL